MAGTGKKYVVNVHTDSANVIVFDGITVEYFNDPTAATAATTVIKVGNSVGPAVDSFQVTTDYPAAYTGTDPATLRINDHIIAAFGDIQAIINAVPYVGFGGGGPVPQILTLNTLVGGTGYPTVTDFVAKLTGGTGYGALAKITAAGGSVTVVTLLDGGEGYVAGDVLSANLGVKGDQYPAVPGTGFTITVATVGSPITNPNYA